MNEYYWELKKAIKALEEYMTTLEEDEHNYSKFRFKKVTRLQKIVHSEDDFVII